MATKAEILKKHKMTEQEFYQKYPTQEAYMKEFGEGGSIHIKPENRGKFTAYKQRTGKTTEEALHSPNAHVRQMANFARNAAKWKHADGGFVDKTDKAVYNKWAKKYPNADKKLLQMFYDKNVTPNIVGQDTSFTENAVYYPGIHGGNKMVLYKNGGMMKSSRITPEITRLDNGGSLTYGEQASLQDKQAALDYQKTLEQRAYDAKKAKENSYGQILSGGINNISSTTPLSNTGNSTYDFYNNKINKENKMISGVAQTGLGLIGTAIGGPAGGMVGSSLGSAVGKLFENGGIMNDDNKSNKLTYYEGGFTHEDKNPRNIDQGIKLGKTGNVVEKGETRINDFIFTNQHKYDKTNTFADMSKKIEKQTIGRRDNDKISRTTFDRKIGALAEKQEFTKAINNKTDTVKFAKGGKMYGSGGGTDDFSGTNPYSNPYRDNSYLLPYQSDIKSSFMDIPSGINTPVEQPNNSRYNFEKIEPKNPIPIIDKALVNPNFTPTPLNRIMPNSIKNPGLGKMPNYSPLNPDGSLSVKQPFKDKAGNKLNYTFNGKEYNPESKYVEPVTKNKVQSEKNQMDLSWLNPALQMGLSSLGNYKPLVVKNYQMKPDLLDSTQAKRENRDTFSGLNSDLATSGLTGGQYIASRMGSAAQQAGENAKIDNVYRTANTAIKNQFKQMNTATDKEVQELNAREIDASKTAKQFRNQNIAKSLGQARQDKLGELSVLNPDYEWVRDKFGRKLNQRRIPGTQAETPNYSSQSIFGNTKTEPSNKITTEIETKAKTQETAKAQSPAKKAETPNNAQVTPPVTKIQIKKKGTNKPKKGK